MTLITGTWPSDHKSPILRLIRSLGFPNMQTGPWVAGGAVRRMMDNDPGKLGAFDIDIFPSSATNGEGRSADDIVRIMRLRHDFENLDAVPVRRGQATTNVHIGGVLVQVIGGWVYPSAANLIGDFDYTVCKFVTDGWTWMADHSALGDLRERRLVLSDTQRSRNSTYRLGKYCLYGFTPAPGTLAETIGIDRANFGSRFDGPNIVALDAY